MVSKTKKKKHDKKNGTKKIKYNKSFSTKNAQVIRHRPTIGILSIPMTIGKHKYTHSYIPASYVKWIEMNNGKVIPIPYDTPKGAIDMILNQVNGILFIGGQVDSNMIREEYVTFMETFNYIFNHAKKSNNQGKYFPLFSICLGMEILGMMSEGIDNVIKDYVSMKGISHVKARNYNSKLKFIQTDNNLGQLFNKEEQHLLEKNPCVFQNHGFGFLSDYSYMKKWKKYWDIVATSKTNDNKNEFVSMFEFKKYPFYGIQFHPEKILFEWELDTIGRGKIFRQISNKLSHFFIQECQKNDNVVKIPKLYIKNYNLWSRSETMKKIQPNKKLLKENHSSFENSYYFDVLS
jgi:gamma-glutamyl hydrolase|tara:strand:+ start:1556 stop:2599 length:1044 start_codon:yes stop_codon:yes gene_type:complete